MFLAFRLHHHGPQKRQAAMTAVNLPTAARAGAGQNKGENTPPPSPRIICWRQAPALKMQPRAFARCRGRDDPCACGCLSHFRCEHEHARRKGRVWCGGGGGVWSAQGTKERRYDDNESNTKKQRLQKGAHHSGGVVSSPCADRRGEQEKGGGGGRAASTKGIYTYQQEHLSTDTPH